MWLQALIRALEGEYRKELINWSFADDNITLAREKHRSDILNFLKTRFDLFDIIILVFFLGFFLGNYPK
ncbi:MAG TPA: hypothetical protein VN278_07755 [Methanosarcina sp.]|nr:hypothetical protein [Methanosarcina sp.]